MSPATRPRSDSRHRLLSPQGPLAFPHSDAEADTDDGIEHVIRRLPDQRAPSTQTMSGERSSLADLARAASASASASAAPQHGPGGEQGTPYASTPDDRVAPLPRPPTDRDDLRSVTLAQLQSMAMGTGVAVTPIVPGRSVLPLPASRGDSYSEAGGRLSGSHTAIDIPPLAGSIGDRSNSAAAGRYGTGSGSGSGSGGHGQDGVGPTQSGSGRHSRRDSTSSRDGDGSAPRTNGTPRLAASGRSPSLRASQGSFLGGPALSGLSLPRRSFQGRPLSEPDGAGPVEVSQMAAQPDYDDPGE